MKNILMNKKFFNGLIGTTVIVSTMFLNGCSPKPTIDVMANAEIVFDKYEWSGYGSIDEFNCKIDYDKTNIEIRDFVEDIYFEYPENNHELSNGDEITIKAIYSEETAKQIGVNVVNTEKTFKVEGFREIPKNEEDIDSKIIELLDTDAMDKLKTAYKEGWGRCHDYKFTKLYNVFLVDNLWNKVGAVYKIEYKEDSTLYNRTDDVVKYRMYYTSNVAKGQETYPLESVEHDFCQHEDCFSTPDIFKTSLAYKKYFDGRTEGYSGFVFNVSK